jgi:hypothetical protein
MLKHEVMASDEWHDNGPQDLITVLCIQISIEKMQLRSLSVAYDCPYHNSTATMEWGTLFTMLTSENHSTTPFTSSVVGKLVGCTAKFSKKGDLFP